MKLMNKKRIATACIPVAAAILSVLATSNRCFACNNICYTDTGPPDTNHLCGMTPAPCWLCYDAVTGAVQGKYQTEAMAKAFCPDACGIIVVLDDDTVRWAHEMPSDMTFDVVRGDLGVLRASSGDFTAATNACLADNASGLSVPSGAAPEAGQGFWYLVRANVAAGGSYGDSSSRNVGSRTEEIQASTASCP
jgi:hypothetical protein